MSESEGGDQLPTLAHPRAADESQGVARTLPGSNGTAAGGPPAPDRPQVPGYEILGLLGEGGVAVVYRALHRRLKRVVALKLIKGGVGDADRACFRAEAEVVAQLQHPNIVQVYDIGDYPGPDGEPRPFIALEYVAGGSLDRHLRRAALPPLAAAALVEALAHAVQAIHDLKLVHRDLKPANILLAGGGLTPPAEGVTGGVSPPPAAPAPKVADFGLAKLLDPGGATLHGGQLVGTPSYMAPEQAEGRPAAVGPAADVYSLGAVLYEALTGRPPFKGASLTETLDQVRRLPPPAPRSLRPQVPRDLETICLKCLRKAPADRYGSAAALAADLRAFLEGRAIRARRVGVLGRGWRWCRRKPLEAALVGLSLGMAAVALGVGLWYNTLLGAAECNVREGANALGLAEANTRRERERAAALHELAETQQYFARLSATRERAARPRPGWTWRGLDDLAYAAGLDTRARRLEELRGEAAGCLLALDVRHRRALPVGFSASRMAFHPDGRSLAVAQAKASLYLSCAVALVEVDSGKVVRRLDVPVSVKKKGVLHHVQDGVTALAYAPDGRWLVAGTRTGRLLRWDLTAAGPRPCAWAGHGDDDVRCVRFSPDGASLYSCGADGVVKRWAVTAGWRQAAAGKANGPLAVGPHGGWLASADGARVEFLDADTLLPTRAVPSEARVLAASPDGHTLAVASGSRVGLVDRADGRALHAFRGPGGDAHEGPASCMAFNADGTLLLTSSDTTKHARLWEVASGRLVADLVIGNGPCGVAFAPKGGALAALAANRVRFYELGGLAAQTLLPPQREPAHAVAFADGGRSLAVLAGSRSGGRGEVSVLPLRGAARPSRWPVTLPEERMPVHLAADPGGRWVACTADGGVQLWHRDGQAPPAPLGASDVHGLLFGPGGRLWSAAEADVCMREVPGGKRLARWDNKASRVVTGLSGIWALDVGRRWVLAGGRDGNVRLLRTADASWVDTWALTAGQVCAVALNGDETLAAVGTWRGELRVLRVPGGDKVAALAAHADRLNAVAFRPDGLLATGSADGTVRFWRYDGRCLCEWLTVRVPAGVRRLAFSPSGQDLAVVLHGERAPRLWHVDRLAARLKALGLEGGSAR